MDSLHSNHRNMLLVGTKPYRMGSMEGQRRRIDRLLGQME